MKQRCWRASVSLPPPALTAQTDKAGKFPGLVCIYARPRAGHKSWAIYPRKINIKKSAAQTAMGDKSRPEPNAVPVQIQKQPRQKKHKQKGTRSYMVVAGKIRIINCLPDDYSFCPQIKKDIHQIKEKNNLYDQAYRRPGEPEHIHGKMRRTHFLINLGRIRLSKENTSSHLAWEISFCSSTTI